MHTCIYYFCFVDNNFFKYPLTWKLGRILVFILLCGVQPMYGLFIPGKEYRYLYNATSSSGVLLPSSSASSWSLNGILVIQARENAAVMQVFFLRIYLKYFLSTPNKKYEYHL